MNPFFTNANLPIYFVETTHSTNLLLNELAINNRKAKSSFPDFFCVVSDYQTAGRGQGNKLWQSNKGENLLASFFFQPFITPPQQIYFNYFFALTIRKVVSLYAENVRIKKPNDIWVNDKKIAGLLIEHSIQGEKLNYTIAGVGINVNQIQFDESLPNPTSLKLITHKNLNREIILEEIIDYGKEYYHKLQNSEFTKLEQEYESYVKIAVSSHP